jgi:tetratricopeptide (TPR) repeat protein
VRFRVISTLSKKNFDARVAVAALTASGLAACSIEPRWLTYQHKAHQALKEGKPAVAKALLKQSIGAASQAQPMDAADAYRELSILSIDRELAMRALELAEQKFGPEDVSILPYLSAVGQVAYRQHDFKMAQKFYNRALRLHDAHHLKDDAEFADVLGGLISASCAAGQCIDAEPLYKRLIDVRTQTLGANHEHTLSAKMMYAENCERRLQYGPARQIYLDCVAGAQAKNPQLLPTLLTCVGRLYNRERRFAEAEQALLAANRLAAVDRSASQHFRTFSELATTYENQKRIADADNAFKNALAAAVQTTGSQSPETSDLEEAYRAFKKRN